jgi:hypothetical protein
MRAQVDALALAVEKTWLLNITLTDNNIDVSTSHRLEKEAGGRVVCIVPD